MLMAQVIEELSQADSLKLLWIDIRWSWWWRLLHSGSLLRFLDELLSLLWNRVSTVDCILHRGHYLLDLSLLQSLEFFPEHLMFLLEMPIELLVESISLGLKLRLLVPRSLLIGFHLTFEEINY